MAIYPEIKPDWGYSLEPVYWTEKLGPTDGDFTQRRRRRSQPRYRIELGYSARLEYSRKQELINFFRARYGSWEAFTFYDFVPSVVTEHQFGTGDGTTVSFVVENWRDLTEVVVKLDGVTVYDYSVENRTAPDGQDTIHFVTAPADGAVLTLSGNGCLRVPNCIFADDKLSAPLEKWRRYAIEGIEIIQVGD